MVINCGMKNKQEGQTCVANSNCDSGLHCETCVADGNPRPRCTRIQPFNPTSQVHQIQVSMVNLYILSTHKYKYIDTHLNRCWWCGQVKGLPFNRYSWLTTHNSYARLGVKSATGSVIIAPTNQQDSITSQLNVCLFLLVVSNCGCLASCITFWRWDFERLLTYILLSNYVVRCILTLIIKS